MPTIDPEKSHRWADHAFLTWDFFNLKYCKTASWKFFEVASSLLAVMNKNSEYFSFLLFSSLLSKTSLSGRKARATATCVLLD